MKGKNWRLVLYIVFCIYLLALLKITVFRSGFSLHGLLQNGNLNLTLFEGYGDLIARGKFFTIVYLFVGNIIWFVPFGCLLPYLRKRPISLGVMALWGLGLSLLIETAQYVFGTGVSELDDLVLNTAGTVIGYLLYRILKKARAARQHEE